MQIGWQRIENKAVWLFPSSFLVSVCRHWNINSVVDICWKCGEKIWFLSLQCESHFYARVTCCCFRQQDAIAQTRLALLHGIQAAVATFGVNTAVLLAQRDLLSFMGGWRISFMIWLLRTYFCTRNALNGKTEVQKSACKACVILCEFGVCVFILNVFKFHFPLGNCSAFPWHFAVVSWKPDIEITF